MSNFNKFISTLYNSTFWSVISLIFSASFIASAKLFPILLFSIFSLVNIGYLLCALAPFSLVILSILYSIIYKSLASCTVAYSVANVEKFALPK